MKLTKQTIDDLTILPGKAERFVWDETMPRFGRRIRAGGKRTWVVQYRLGKKQRRITIGTVERLDPDQARKRAKTALAKVRLGTDAEVEKSEARAQASVTFANVAQRLSQTVCRPSPEAERLPGRRTLPAGSLEGPCTDPHPEDHSCRCRGRGFQDRAGERRESSPTGRGRLWAACLPGLSRKVWSMPAP